MQIIIQLKPKKVQPIKTALFYEKNIVFKFENYMPES